MRKLIFLLLLMAATSGELYAQTAISDAGDLDATSVTSPADVRVPASNDQAGTPGTKADLGLDDIALVSNSELMTATAHGLSSGDVGKPLFGAAIWDDTDVDQHADWILVQVVDSNTLRVLPTGSAFDIPVALLDGGNGYSIATSGRHVFWDESDGQYEAARPSDSVADHECVLAIVSVDTTTFRAISAATGPKIFRNDVVVVRASGTASTDNTNFGNAVTALEAIGGGTIYIDGEVNITGSHTLNDPISILRAPGAANAELKFNNNAGILWQGYSTDPVDVSSGGDYITLDATGAFQDYIAVTTGSLAVGDWFFALSDDTITGVSVASTIATYHPGELHQVKEIRDTSGGKDYIIFDDFIVDALATTQRCIKMSSMIDGVTVRDIRITHTGTTPTGHALSFRGCVNVRVENCIWIAPGPNEVQFFYCANSVVTNCTFESPVGYAGSDGYHIVVGDSNRIIVSNNMANGARHFVTTTATTRGSSPNFTRHGECRNLLVTGNVISWAGDSSNSLNPIDTHESGYGVMISNNLITIATDPQDPVTPASNNANRGISIRSRKAFVKGNTVNGGSGFMKAIEVLGADAIVEGNTLSAGWMGLVIRGLGSDTLGNINGCIVRGNTFHDLSGPAIDMQDDADHQILYNRMIDCGSSDGYVIDIEADVDDGIRIIGNDIPKGSNTDAFRIDSSATISEIYVENNVLSGYTDCSMGWDWDTSNSVDFLRAYGHLQSGGADHYAIMTVSGHSLDFTEFDFCNKIQTFLKMFFCFAGKADNDVAAQV